MDGAYPDIEIWRKALGLMITMARLENSLHHGSVADLHTVGDDNLIMVKALREEFINNRLIKERFEREGEILGKLRQSNVPKLVTVDIPLNTPCFAYEYIDGICLNEFIQTEQTRHNEAIDIIRKLLGILSRFHDINLVHSDISPDNIIINKNHDIHIIDFGSADLLQTNDMATSTWISKYCYCSPEQAQGRKWSFPSDLYQAGLVLYEILSGKRFNDGKGRAALAMAANPHINTLDTLDQRYQPVLKALLEPSVEKRCQSPHEALILLNTI